MMSFSVLVLLPSIILLEDDFSSNFHLHQSVLLPSIILLEDDLKKFLMIKMLSFATIYYFARR